MKRIKSIISFILNRPKILLTYHYVSREGFQYSQPMELIRGKKYSEYTGEEPWSEIYYNNFNFIEKYKKHYILINLLYNFNPICVVGLQSNAWILRQRDRVNSKLSYD